MIKIKTISLIILALLVATRLFSQDFTDVKLCINPGHGGHDGDDRFMEITGFWESEGNLTKGLYLRDIMEGAGATIVMSRTTNFTEDDLPLSQISQIANDNNVDFFQAIHSNGYNGVTNYPLMLFRGYDNDPVFPEAKEMSHIMWQKLWDHGNGWTHSGERVRGDWSFYDWGTQGLGVLRGLEMPGVLSEGSFHDYPPESWRLQNLEYRKHEAWVFARSYVDYFEKDSFNIGIVAGIIRDPYSSPGHYTSPSTIDVDAPVNSATVTLTPGNIVYEVDTMNNGYYFFDSLPPGDYTICVRAQNFTAVSTTVTVIANETSFENKYVQVDTTIAPQVLYHTPVSTIDDSVAVNQEMLVYFDYPMNTDSVENAISIDPEVELVFAWDDDLKVLSIKPQTIYVDDSHYTITISTTAQHIWNVSIAEPYIIDFYTQKRLNLDMLDMYPKNGQEEVSTKLQFRLYFDAPISETSAIDNIILYDVNDNVVPITDYVFFDEDGKGFYFFSPETDLELNSDYKVVISENLADTYGVALGTDMELSFKTITEDYELGNVFIDFESISSWWDPDGSGSTVGTVDELTTFSQSADYVINGSYSGKLNYVFANESGGLCREHNSATPGVGSDIDSKIGFWVFGDMSYNILEYWFYPPTGYVEVHVDTIDWAGWELRYVPFTALGDPGEARLTSLVVRQTENGAKKGTMYFDDGQIISTVGIADHQPSELFLKQNYPNPFSNSTTFSYQLPYDSEVKLTVYNTLGQQVATLVDENQPGGNYNFVWNTNENEAGSLNPGMYIYRFETTSLKDKSKVKIESGSCVMMK